MTRRGAKPTARSLVAAVLLLAVPGALGVGAPGVRADAAVHDTPDLAPRAKRLYMITDSVGLGAQFALPNAFPPDWEITLDGDAGEFTDTLTAKYVAPRLTTTPDVFGDHAIVAAGYNYPYWDQARFDRSVDAMIATLEAAGVKYIHWVTLREVKQQYVSPGGWRQIQPYYWYFPEVNDRLEMALDRHPNLFLVDWAAVADQSGLTYDAIHLNTVGSALYSRIVRESVVNAETAAPDDSVLKIDIPDPAGVRAVALNLTTVGSRAPGYLTAYPCDEGLPTLSNHNYTRAQVVAHSVVTRVDASGSVCVFVRRASQVIVDITGRFGADSGILPSAPARLVDTRVERSPITTTPRELPLFATSAGAAALSVTALNAGGPGFVRVAPCASTAETSTVNVMGPAAVPNLTVVEGQVGDRLCVSASRPMDVLVDGFVSFDTSNAVAVGTPDRVLDSRTGGGAALAPGSVAVLDGGRLGVSAGTTGVMVNLTAVDAQGVGYLAAYPCSAGVPATSSLNYVPGSVVANFVIVPPDADGDVCVYTLERTHVVVDLVGTTTTGFSGGAPQRLLDTRQRPAA